jgi:hypothetical protein
MSTVSHSNVVIGRMNALLTAPRAGDAPSAVELRIAATNEI